jgi:hypothetical protein
LYLSSQVNRAFVRKAASGSLPFHYNLNHDVESWFYVLLYIVSGKRLPWSASNHHDQQTALKHAAITYAWNSTLEHVAPEARDVVNAVKEELFARRNEGDRDEQEISGFDNNVAEKVIGILKGAVSSQFM